MIRFISLGLISLNFTVWAQLNSVYDEQCPVLNSTYEEIYFTVANHPSNTSGKRDLGDIWYSKKVGGSWRVAQPVKGLINNPGYNAVLGFSIDGNEMFLYGHYNTHGDVASSQGISVSKRIGDTWSLPRNETVPYFLNKRDGSGGHITTDKSIFVFSAEGRAYDSFGNEDVYVCFNKVGVWTEPLNLGSSINTSHQELAPFYNQETKQLYFSSNKPGGLGSADVYMCERMDDTWQRWSQPINLGTNVNSDGRELFYRTVPNGFLLTSTRNSDGYGDIREVEYKLSASDSLPKVEVVTPIAEQELLTEIDSFTISGVVTSLVSGEEIDARMLFTPSSNPSLVAVKGRYSTTLPIALKYMVNISASGYITSEEEISVPSGSLGSIRANFTLQPISIGVSVNLKHVLFKQSSAELLPESYEELDRVVAFLRDNPSVAIELAGHTDNSGKTKLNQQLSIMRADRVKYYLVSKGVEGARIKGVGYGGKRPLASNKTEEGRMMNRRVEFKILKYEPVNENLKK